MGPPDLDAARRLRVEEYFVPAERERVTTEVVPAAIHGGYWEGSCTSCIPPPARPSR
jgi:hypothetical protein